MVIGQLVNLPKIFSKLGRSQPGAHVAGHRFLCTHYFTGLAPLGLREAIKTAPCLMVIVACAVHELCAPLAPGPRVAGPPVDAVHVRGVDAVVGAAGWWKLKSFPGNCSNNHPRFSNITV